jgi:hypothetical protein
MDQRIELLNMQQQMTDANEVHYNASREEAQGRRREAMSRGMKLSSELQKKMLQFTLKTHGKSRK